MPNPNLKNVNWKKAQPAPKFLSRLLRANFPQITRTGIYNDRYVAGTKIKSSHAEGRGIDIHLNAKNADELSLGNQLVEAMKTRAHVLGIDNIIWNKEIWSQRKGGPRPYHGKSSHTDHIHVEFTRKGSQQKTLDAIEVDIAIIRTGREELADYFASIG